MRSIASSLYNLAVDLGVNFSFNSSVEQINISNQEVKSIKINNKEFFSDIIVCNNDVHFVYNKLLKHKSILTKPKKTKDLHRQLFFTGELIVFLISFSYTIFCFQIIIKKNLTQLKMEVFLTTQQFILILLLKRYCRMLQMEKKIGL